MDGRSAKTIPSTSALRRQGLLVLDPRIKGLESKHCTRMSYTITPQSSGTHVFGITANGETRLFVDKRDILSHQAAEEIHVAAGNKSADFLNNETIQKAIIAAPTAVASPYLGKRADTRNYSQNLLIGRSGYSRKLPPLESS